MANEPDWAKVLEVFYEQGGYLIVPTGTQPKGSVSEEDEELIFEEDNIFNHVDVPKTSVTGILDYLTQIGLVRIDEEETDALNKASSDTIFLSNKLTEKGFKVAHERELAKRQDRTNTALVAFTFTLVLASIVTNYPHPAVQKFGGILVLILLGAIIYYTDFLEPYSL